MHDFRGKLEIVCSSAVSAMPSTTARVTPCFLAVAAILAPAFGDRFSDGENSAREPGPHVDIEPFLQIAPLSAHRKQVDAFADFAESHDAEEEVLFACVADEIRHALPVDRG